jgi:membrane-bound metal-dependent hydrolase YbcI (DUF457 family)
MFVGHFAVALGARRAVPRVSLGTLVAAAILLDLIWPILLLAGVERVRIDPGNTAFTPLAFDHYPWSHSLLTTAAWGVAAGALVFARLRNLRAAAIVGLLVVSHWLLDFVTHRPDLPLWPGGPLAGAGLWQSIPGTVVVEGALFAIAVEMYRRAFPARDATGRWALVAFVALTALIWISQPFSPPPPGAHAIAGAGLAMWLFPLWAAWIDRHRRATPA